MAGPADNKDEGALRTIGELSAMLGVKPHVLRYWEAQFEQLQPLKRAGGRRLYRPQDVTLVRRIDQLVNRQGYSLRGAQAALQTVDGGAQAAQAAPITTGAPLDKAAIKARLVAIRHALAEALETG